MTIINNSYKFVFVHIPKSAGTTITSIFSKYTNYCDLEIGGTDFGEKIQPAYKKRFGLAKHSSAREIKSLMGAVEWSRYFTFAFVRNPYARAYSAYNFLRKWESPNQIFNEKMRSFNSFDEFVDSDYWYETDGPDEIFKPQVHWLRGSPASDNLAVEFIGRVENIEKDIADIFNIIGLKKVPNAKSQQTRLNVTTEPDAFKKIEIKTAKKVYEKYKHDFNLLGYAPDCYK